MQKILIIAQNGAKADNCENHFRQHFKVRKVYPSAKSFPSHFDAVLIYFEDTKEINFMKDLITRYHDVPLKVFFGNVAYGDAKTYNAASFTAAEKE